MSNFIRLQKALKKQGIAVTFQDGIYQFHNPHAHASVLLPATLPLEEKAVRQLLAFAAVHVPGHSGHVCKACATPDFHPGTIAPVGSIVATTPDMVIPAAVGTDINCAVRLVRTGLTLAQLETHKESLTRRLTRALLEDGRNIPVRSVAFAALFDDGPTAWIDLLHRDGLWKHVDKDRLFAETARAIGLNSFGGKRRYAPEAFTGTREIIRDPCLGTIGSGNHFVEFQIVDAILDRYAAYTAGLVPDEAVFMIHSGSRDVGFYVGQRWMDRARAAWPDGIKHPESGLYGLTGELATEYAEAMGVAARYAWANRVVLTEMIRECLHAEFEDDRSALIVDVPHNVILQENGLNIHRKGATPAHEGDLALIPGSIGDYSYVVTGLGNTEWLSSCAHGAGRAIRRQALRAKRQYPGHELPWHCITLREERRIEEAPAAYKRIGPVIEAQETAGMISPVARLRPWMTFKA